MRKFLFSKLVRMKGLEPPRPETLDPKSNAATNYATCASCGWNCAAKVHIFSLWAKHFLGRHAEVLILFHTLHTGWICQFGC